jgi:hypothetical protein
MGAAIPPIRIHAIDRDLTFLFIHCYEAWLMTETRTSFYAVVLLCKAPHCESYRNIRTPEILILFKGLQAWCYPLNDLSLLSTQAHYLEMNSGISG